MRPLLHIGYHKTGTASLQNFVFPAKAGAGFSLVAGGKGIRPTFVEANPFGFDSEAARERFEPEIREAEFRGLVPVLSAERLSGNPHFGGYDSKLIADRLAAAFPEARVLVAIREQAGMLVSLYKQYVKRGGAASFQQYVAGPPGAGQAPRFRLDFLEYHRLVAHYQSLFGGENVLVLPYEILRTRPEAFLDRIGAFVGTPATEADLRWKNASPSALSLSLKRHANRWVVRSAFNPAPPFALDGTNESLLRLCNAADARVTAALRDPRERRWRRVAEDAIGDRYAQSNALTAGLTGLDLRAFGYTCAPTGTG
jgi:hypothetical protein